MSSYTSNSNRSYRQIPIKNGNIALFICVLTTLVLFVGTEWVLRNGIFTPIFPMDDITWYDNLKNITSSPETLDVIFYGSSRTQLAVSPDAFTEQMKTLGEKCRCWNMGLAASDTVGIMAHIREHIYADVVVIEQLGLQFSNPVSPEDIQRYEKIRNTPFNNRLEVKIRRAISRNIYFFRANILSSLFSRQYYKLERHENGWVEARFNRDNPKLIEHMKKHNESYDLPKQISESQARKNQKIYKNFFTNITADGARLVIIRMPQGGKLGEITDKLLSAKYHNDFIVKDKNILYIDANRDPRLHEFKTFEYSHLDAEDAIGFSKELATIIYDWLEPNVRKSKN